MDYYEVDKDRKIPKTTWEKISQVARRSLKIELFVGLWVIIREYLRPGNCATIMYPMEKAPIDNRYRAVHRLMRFMESESERCIGCGLCEKICISNCIRMETSHADDGRKHVNQYGINLSRCIYCGFCAEVCPELAIVHGKEYEHAAEQRTHYGMKDDLLTRLDELAKQVEFEGSGSLRVDASDFVKKTPTYYEAEQKAACKKALEAEQKASLEKEEQNV